MKQENIEGKDPITIEGKDPLTIDFTNPKGGAIPKLGTKEFNNSAMEMFGGKPKQQTAVEWLVNEIFRRYKFTFQQLNCQPLEEAIQQAKEMEKQQQGYSVEDLECAWNSSDQNMRFQFSSSAYKGITFKQWLEKYEHKR